MLKCFSKKKSKYRQKCSNCGGIGENKEKAEKSDVIAAGQDSLNERSSQKDGHYFSKTIEITNPNQMSSSSCYACNSNSSDEEAEHYCNMELQPQYVQYGTDLPGLAYMTVAKHDPFYNMNHPRRGKAVIFNFDRWDNTTIPDLALNPRQGSAKDRDDLTQSLQRLDFEVESHDNCGNLEMWKILKHLRNEDHSDADCLVVVFLSHGERNTVYMRDGTQIPVNLIWESFEAHLCPTLAGKPKIFIIQACRGRKYDGGTKMAGSTPNLVPGSISDETDSGTFSYVIPNAADILVAFSCPLGHYSWRSPEKGSWFIQSICTVFDKYAYHLDLQTLFTTVAREVALNFESNTTQWESDKKKQVTSTSSTLIRTVRFKPKLTNNPANTIIPNGNGNIISVPASISPKQLEPAVPSSVHELNGNLDTSSTWISSL